MLFCLIERYIYVNINLIFYHFFCINLQKSKKAYKIATVRKHSPPNTHTQTKGIEEKEAMIYILIN